MDILSAPTRYADALLFAGDVIDAATHMSRGEHGRDRLRAPYVDELLSHQSDWSWCDNRQDVDLAAAGPLRTTVDYLARRNALALPAAAAPAPGPAALWPDVESRVSVLRAALEFAAETAGAAWPTELDGVLKPWIRQRLATWLAPPAGDETLRAFAERIRHAVTTCHRYRDVRYELFADRHWTGRPAAGWLSPDIDLVLRAPFDGYCEGHSPIHILRVDDQTGSDIHATFTVANHYRSAPVGYPVSWSEGELRLGGDLAADAHCAAVAHEAVLALGYRVDPPSPPSGTGGCPHRWAD